MSKQQKSRLLLVEDSLALTRVYKEYLKPMSVNVSSVTEGGQGLEQIEETGGERREGAHRPAKLYRALHPDKVEIIK